MLLAVGIVGAGCLHAPERPVVAVSLLPQAWFVESLVGSDVDVRVLLPPGANEATFEPNLQTLLALRSATLYIRLGHPAFAFESTWLPGLLADGGPDTVVACPGTKGSPPAQRAEDPHVWLSPTVASAMADCIAAALERGFPAWRASIEARHRTLREDIAGLDRELGERLATVSGRTMFVHHPAWGHFASHYGIEQVAIEQDGKEPDPLRLSRYIQRARAAGARVIFVEPQFSSRSAAAVADAIGASLVTIDPLARDWPDNLRRVADEVAKALQ